MMQLIKKKVKFVFHIIPQLSTEAKMLHQLLKRNGQNGHFLHFRPTLNPISTYFRLINVLFKVDSQWSMDQ